MFAISMRAKISTFLNAKFKFEYNTSEILDFYQGFDLEEDGK